MSIRLESDSVGSLPVPSDAYYGIQSLQAKENFPISGRAMHPAFLHSLTQIKLAAARANARTGQSPPPIADAICAACGEVLSGGFANQFPVDASVGMVTALCPYIGYKKAAALDKESLSGGVPIRDLVLRDGLLEPETLSRLLNPATQCGGEV